MFRSELSSKIRLERLDCDHGWFSLLRQSHQPLKKPTLHIVRQLIMVTKPHFLLICDSAISTPATIDGVSQPAVGLGKWNFVLERIDGPERLEAQDCESYIHQDRLALLAVVRGLEALEQTSTVRLVTTSRYVDRGLRFGLPNWRETKYQWESFGMRKPIRNADLWKRIDVALSYHEIACRLLKSSIAVTDSQGDEFLSSLVGAAAMVQSSTEAEVRLPCKQAVDQFANGGFHGSNLEQAQLSLGLDQRTAQVLARQAAEGFLTADIEADSVRSQPTDARKAIATRSELSPKDLAGRLASNRVGYRIDAAHRTLATSSLEKSHRSQPKNKPVRLQWWEMALRWDGPSPQAFPQAAAYGG